MNLQNKIIYLCCTLYFENHETYPKRLFAGYGIRYVKLQLDVYTSSLKHVFSTKTITTKERKHHSYI